MLTHIGRKSGKPHQVVLEVVGHERTKGIFTIASGWGEKSDWYRNVLSHPKVQVNSGTHVFTALAVHLTEGEAKNVLCEYAVRHPFAFKELASVIVGVRSRDLQETVHLMASHIPLLDLRPVEESQNG